MNFHIDPGNRRESEFNDREHSVRFLKGSFDEALAEFAHSLPKIVVRYVVVYTTKDIMGHLETSYITIEIVVVGRKDKIVSRIVSRPLCNSNGA